MRVLTIALLLLLVGFAGCAETDPEPTDTTDDSDSQVDDTTDETVDDVEETTNNTAPVAILTADVDNGTAPLLVNVTVDGTDADGDNLTYVLALGNDTFEGSELPTTLNFTLDEGNHTFTLTVSDGELEHVVELTIAVVEAVVEDLGPCGGEPEPCIIAEDTWVFFYSDGSCHMKDEFVQNSAGGIYINDRHTGQVGTGFVAGGGTWVYMEDNGIPGLQLGGMDPSGSFGEAGAYTACQNPDQLLF